MLFNILRLAARRLIRRPGINAIMILALGAGTGLCAGAFTVAWGIFLRGLPFENSARIVRVQMAVGGESLPVSAADYLAWRDDRSAFAALAGWYGSALSLSAPNQATLHLNGAYVSSETFRAVGVQPHLGRDFTTGDELPGAAQVAIIGDDLWRTRFGSDTRVLGQLVKVDARPVTIIGVMPPGFGFPLRHEIWLPLQLDPIATAKGTGNQLQVFGRLKEGVAAPQAQRHLEAITRRTRPASSGQGRRTPPRVTVASYVLSYTEDIQSPIYLLLAGTALMLLIVCASVALLAFADSLSREPERAVRLMLGESRRGMAAQIAAESMLVAVLGSLASLPLIYATTRLYMALQGGGVLSFWMSLSLDTATLLAAIGLISLATLAGHFLPALRGAREDPDHRLRERAGTAGTSRSSIRTRLLIVLQFATATVLLVAMGLLAKSFENKLRLEVGGQPRSVFIAQLMLPFSKYSTAPAQLAFLEDLETRLARIAGPGNVAFASAVAAGYAPAADMEVRGNTLATAAEPIPTTVLITSRDYFSVLRESPAFGRGFTLADRVGSEPVAAVNSSLAATYLGGHAALGRQIRLRTNGQWGRWRTIVGVVPDFLAAGSGERSSAYVFVPLAQAPSTWMSLLLRTKSDALAVGNAVEQVVRSRDPDATVFSMSSLAHCEDSVVQPSRALAEVFSTFALCALAVALLGLYGVMTLTVAERRREIAVRIALGASSPNIAGLILRPALARAGIGVAIGIVIAIALRRILSSFLFRVAPIDPVVLGAVVIGESLMVLLACLLPATRAIATQPSESLKTL
ncbi:MAG: ABC transporter permease [Acidobacteriota bacterium]|nr:ABC transporter permease [Acidobacteriota bacterium]